jgi:hypothetical protein
MAAAAPPEMLKEKPRQWASGQMPVTPNALTSPPYSLTTAVP